MAYALLNSEGFIAEVLLKISHSLRLSDGQRIAAYNPPSVDREMYAVQAVEPVLPELLDVQFTVTDKPGAAAARLARQLAEVDEAVDAIYKAVIGSRGPEYTEAEAQAQAFKDAGYTGTAEPYVTSWSAASGMTDEESADDILAQAAAWRAASLNIRQARLIAKQGIRDGDPAAIPTWLGFVAAIRSALGV